MKKIVIVAVALFFILSMLGIYFAKEYLEKPVDIDDNSTVIVEIEEGLTASEISQILYEKKLIKNKKYFLNYIKKNNLNNLKSGYYELKKSQNLMEISSELNKGARPIGIKVTFPEGFTAYEIGQKLFENKLINDINKFVSLLDDVDLFYEQHPFLRDNNIKSLEGFLFPDTYYFSGNISNEEILDQMIYRFEEIIYKYGILDKLPEEVSLNEIITFASIIQKESSNIEQMPTIAGVFKKRLNIDMPLQSCATVEYELGRELSAKERLSASDIKVDSPYNTYIYKGLPPTPISSVSKEAIFAAINPEKSNYLYFVADKNGNNLFSETYKEHLEKVKQIYGEY